MSEPVPNSGPAIPKIRFPKWYDPDSPETKERRRRLFEAIKAGRTKETDAAADRVHQRFFGKYQ